MKLPAITPWKSSRPQVRKTFFQPFCGRVVGEFRVRRGGRDLEDVVLVIDVGGRDRGARAVMTDDGDDLLGRDLVRDRDRLLRVAGVVADGERELLAEHAA